MREKGTVIFIAIHVAVVIVAAAALVVVNVVALSFLAEYFVAQIDAVAKILGSHVATMLVIYGNTIIISAACATLVNFPLGFMLTYRPWIVGGIVGTLAATTIFLMSPSHLDDILVDCIMLAVCSSLAAQLGSRMKSARHVR